MEKPKNGKRAFLKKNPLLYVLFFFPNPNKNGRYSNACAISEVPFAGHIVVPAGDPIAAVESVSNGVEVLIPRSHQNPNLP
eukprot:1582817-Amphidinium_carterae.1